MKKSTKIALIVAGACVLLGVILFAGAYYLLSWDIGVPGSDAYVTETVEIKEDFTDILIETNADNLTFMASDDKTCKVEFYDKEEREHSAAVNNKTLEIDSTEPGDWFEGFSLFSFGSPKITVYLPKESYGALTVSAVTGDTLIPDDFTFDSIDISGATGEVTCLASSKNATDIALSTGKIKLMDTSAKSYDLSVTTGDILVYTVTCKNEMKLGASTGDALLQDVECGSLRSDGTTGDIALTRVIAKKDLIIERTTGDVEFESCDASDINFKTSTGDVTGTLTSEKTFTTDTSTGDVRVPQSASGGTCDISTTTGDIVIDIEK